MIILAIFGFLGGCPLGLGDNKSIFPKAGSQNIFFYVLFLLFLNEKSKEHQGGLEVKFLTCMFFRIFPSTTTCLGIYFESFLRNKYISSVKLHFLGHFSFSGEVDSWAILGVRDDG